MLTFDRIKMMEQIERLPKRLRVAFAAACAQRQLLNYVRTSAANPVGNPEAVARMLGELWDGVERNVFVSERLQRDLDLCDALTPSHDTKSFSGMGFAQSALLSLAYAFDTALGSGTRETTSAAEQACDALYQFIIQRFGVDTNAPSAMSLIDSFPIMQAELSRQQSDLAELRAAAHAPGNESVAIARIKRRAERDAPSFFG